MSGGPSYFGGSGIFGSSFSKVTISQWSDATNYGAITLNGNTTAAGGLGIAGGASGDPNLYLNAPTGGKIELRINGTVAQTITSTGAATFAGAVTATSAAATSNPILTLHNSNTGASNYGISLTNANPDAASRNWAIVTNNAAFGDFVILQSNASGGNPISAGTAKLSMTGTSATFAVLVFPQQATTAGAPAYVKGAIYFDTTLNKLRVGGATAWETITSV